MRLRVRALALATILASGAPGVALAAAPAPAATLPPETVPTLAWRPCHDPAQAGFDCATAKVPLDHAKPRERKIGLAVIRHRATKPGARIGTLFFNPGGPGGAGTQDLPDWLALFPRAAVERFDIVSWDPRGIGDSTAVQCFANADAEGRFFAGIPVAAFPVGAAEEKAWIRRFAEYGRVCKERNGELLEHVSTADTARDLELLRLAVGAPSLNYLGVSYGTFLGATYANLFPDRIRSMILDGNVDPTAFTNRGVRTTDSSTGLRLGSDRALARSLNAMLERCGRAKRTACAFSAGSPGATKTKFERLLQRLQAAPVVLDGVEVSYAVTLTALNGALFTVEPYSHFRGWTHITGILQALWEASGTAQAATRSPAAGAAEPATAAKYASSWQGSAVQCGESPNARPGSAFRRLAEVAAARSGPIGPVVPWADEPCAGWRATAASIYAGPWDRPTANPILVIGNTFDPSTPYEGSIAMARLLARARLLTVDGFGHTTLLNPSDCANRHESAYLIDGTLPPKGTVCRQNVAPFAGP